MDCEICQGRRRIRLPRYKPLMVAEMDVLPPTIDECSKEFPCPECAGGAPYERMAIAKVCSEAPSHLGAKADFIRMMRGHMASALAAKMLDLGMIQFEQGEPDHRGMFPMRGTVGVVSPEHVASFEDRVRERQFEVAAALVAETREEIANWGSYYHGREGGRVEKWQALEWLQDAFKKVRAKFARAA